MNDFHMWTLYDHPRDYPQSFVARRFRILPNGVEATNDMFVAESLDELRALLPHGLCCLPRAFDDDSNIIETWV